MKLIRPLLLCFFVLNLCTCVRAQGIEFFHGTWEEALAKAEAEDKLIFVDAYASWCGPCKTMSRNVFPVAKVGDFFNDSFINMKFDMEKEESTDFRKTHRVSAYPTLFWINSKNEVVHKSVGGKQVDALIEVGNAALAKMDDVEVYAQRWEDGDRDSGLALKYIRALVRQKQPHAKIANDYLRSAKDLTTPDNLNILLIAATQADSRIFDLLTQNKDAVIALAGKKAYENQVSRAVESTLAKAVEFKDEKLIEAAAKKMAKSDPAAGKRIAMRGAYELAAVGNDSKAFLKAMKKYYQKGGVTDPTELDRIYSVAASSKFIHEENILDMAINAGARAAAADAETGFRKYYRLADFLFKQGKMDKALTYANMALEAIPGKQANMERAIQGLIQRIEEGK